MRVSAAETNRINEKLASKREVRCTTFDYVKSFELWANGLVKGRFGTLKEAKEAASVYQLRNPESLVKVIEIKKKVHEFYIKEGK